YSLAVSGGQLTPFGQMLYASPLKWVVMLAPLGFVLFMSFRAEAMSVGAAQAMFWAFAAVMGISISSIFLVFTGQSITQIFFVTAATF
ncbi:Bax inhibitor-1 family protein, partial [Escherichia coli]|nr:Bax inhibitor-1 family protein [Escherichia coli]